MKTIPKSGIIGLFLLVLFSYSSYGQVDPQKKYGEFFRQIQKNKIFSDQKRFVDCEPKANPDSIIKAYLNQKETAGFNLKNFVGEYFDTIQNDHVNKVQHIPSIEEMELFGIKNDTAAMLKHINYLWTDLTKEPGKQKAFSSLLALPNSYIIPGGRFKEIYYWDSYFTMLGLQEAGKVDMIENMVGNFAFLIETYGHIPNGNRSYYLSRSQPPFFALMVELLADTKHDDQIYTTYFDALEKEYRYWMSGDKAVHLRNNEILNRYWDAENTPRPESYSQDEELFHQSHRDSLLFRDVRSAAESGWDFSTRWFDDGLSLKKISTMQLLPVDLNCLLFNLEATLAKASQIKHDEAKASMYRELAERRETLILKYFWDEQSGFFFDYNLKTGTRSSQYTLAGLYPLFFQLADARQAEKVKTQIETKFLKSGGLVTTLVQNSGQQWDYPNAWAPLQWIGYKSMKNYQFDGLANEIAKRWTNLNIKVYFETGKMMEKYDVVDVNRLGGGGEYKAQDGFGWTNGVFLKLWNDLKGKN
jgi:alpha,alpha-trehalase